MKTKEELYNLLWAITPEGEYRVGPHTLLEHLKIILWVGIWDEAWNEMVQEILYGSPKNTRGQAIENIDELFPDVK